MPVSALHYYERLDLIASQRTAGNQRRYPRYMLRRVALISGESGSDFQPLLQPLYYIERALGPYADLEGNVSVNLLPGTITNVVLGKKALKGRTGGITVHDAHVKVDAAQHLHAPVARSQAFDFQ